VLVTGGAGYIGSLVCRELLARGHEVVILDSLVFDFGAIVDLLADPRCRFIRGDIRLVEDLKKALDGVEGVVHLASIVGDPACANDPHYTRQVNYTATETFIDLAKELGVARFLFASSCSVYGAGPSEEILTERSRLVPISLYAELKIGVEKMLVAAMDGQFSPGILRLATIYGMSPRPRFDLVVNTLAARATVEKHIVIYGGNQWRPFVHVADAARAFATCVDADLSLVRGRIYNVGSDEQNYRIHQLGDMIRSVMPETKIDVVDEIRDERNYHVSAARFAEQLGFAPARTVVDGICEVRDAILSGQVPHYRDRRYYNHLV
jgi:nucleoside-diphosphate-sugar epimerase